MKIRLCILLIISLTISSCNGQRSSKLTDKDLVVTNRLFSPNKKLVVYSYYYDNGALPESIGFSSIVKVTDTLGVINKNEFRFYQKEPFSRYFVDKWLNNNTLQVKIDIRPFVRENIKIDTTSFEFENIKIKVIPNDPTIGKTPIIEHYSLSENEDKILVAYRYDGVSELNISVINKNEKIPVLGNIFTCGQTSINYILFGKWTENNEIEIFVNEDDKVFLETNFNKNLSVNVKTTYEKYIEKYSGIEGGWYNKELSRKEQIIKSEFLKEKIIIKARICELNSWGDSYYTKKTNFYYEFIVNNTKYKSYFRATKSECNLKKGNEIEIEYCVNQPIIHKPIKYNIR